MILGNYYKYMGYQLHDSYDALATVKNMSGTLGVQTSYVDYFCKFGRTTNSSAPRMNRVATNIAANGSGIILGSGNVPPTLDDYCLSGNLITTISTSVGMKKGFDDQGNPYIQSVITVTNSGSETITIGECGIYMFTYTSGNALGNAVLLERTALETPITLEPNGVGQITYTVKLNYPTA